MAEKKPLRIGTSGLAELGSTDTIPLANLLAPLTGFTPVAGTVTSADNILTALQKLYGNDAVTQVTLVTVATGNNLFNYYNSI